MSEIDTDNRLDGQWAVVTGSSKGIGLGIAEALAGAGANVVLVARGAQALAGAAEALRARCPGQEVRTLTADTSRPESVDALFAEIEQLPALDVFVANAGAGALISFLDLTFEEWQGTLDLNLTGTFLTCQRAARLMVGSDRSNRCILAVSSIRGAGARPGTAAYAATKAGINQLARVAAYELAEHGIRFNVLSPGITVTPMSADLNPERLAQMTEMVPLRRAGAPADMGAAAAYLCSPAARFVTGTNLVVDGGEDLW